MLTQIGELDGQVTVRVGDDGEGKLSAQTCILTSRMSHFCKSIPGMKDSGYCRPVANGANLLLSQSAPHRGPIQTIVSPDWHPSSVQDKVHWKRQIRETVWIRERAAAIFVLRWRRFINQPCVFTALVFRTFSSYEHWGCWLEGRKTWEHRTPLASKRSASSGKWGTPETSQTIYTSLPDSGRWTTELMF